MIEFSSVQDEDGQFSVLNPTVIRIIGCGGAGSSAVNRVIESGVTDVETIVLNTDLQALNISKANKRIAIGQELTGGLGAGGNPDVGEKAANEDTESIRNIIQGANMIIITAGMGGGTGTGSAPVVAKIAKELGVLTIAIVTTPFDFEGPVRMKNATEGLKKLRTNVDSLIVVPNQQILKIVDRKLNFKESFRLADMVLCQGVQGISDIITKPGAINVDFADVTKVMKDQGDAILGVGIGEGENRATDAAQSAISNPMLENFQIDGATKVLVNISNGGDITIPEIDEIVRDITASASKNVEVIFGVVENPDLGEKISVTVIATGFNSAYNASNGFVEDEEPEEDDSDVFTNDEFYDVIAGKSVVSKRAEPEPEPVTRLSGFGSLNFDLEEDKKPVSSGAVESFRSAERQSRSITPPAGYRTDKKDYSQPAVWRNLDNLSSSINLSDD